MPRRGESSSRRKKSACFDRPVKLFGFMMRIIQNKAAGNGGIRLHFRSEQSGGSSRPTLFEIQALLALT